MDVHLVDGDRSVACVDSECFASACVVVACVVVVCVVVFEYFFVEQKRWPSVQDTQMSE